MKQQTFITILIDSTGRQIDFQRWSYKQAKTVERKIRELYSPAMRFASLFKRDLEKAAFVQCFATPDGYEKSGPVVWQIPAVELLEQFA